jgi:hypothetical protein
MERLLTRRAISRLAAVTLLLGATFFSGCKSGPTDADGIRAGIMQHLAAMNSLNLNGMDLEVTSVSVQGTQAHALVTIRPKSSGPPGAGMQVAYLLEKQGSAWSVVKTESVSGVISHPAAGATSPAPTGPSGAQGDMPNFRDIIQAPPANPSGTLPPGHPPITTGAPPKTSDQSGKPK